MIELTSHIRIFPGHDNDGPNPKIVLLFGEKASLFVDVSNDAEQLQEALAYLTKESLPPLRYVALTHFHDDHIGNLIYLPETPELLVSKNTSRYLARPSTVLSQDQDLDLGGYTVRLILVPSLHAKGCLDVLAENILFTGDSLYYRQSGSSYYYNAQIAYEMLKKHQAIPFTQAIGAHDSPVHTKEEVLAYLTKLAKEGLQNDFE
jgi:glyoxylase-like metal-dependent hydrolase (beta-lactamase superfamily II)